jgi:hypothetical protein
LDNFEIEDLVSLACVDRFYESKLDLLPEAEYLMYGSDERRRLVVRGADKDQFVLWMQANATIDEVQNLIRLVKHIRSMFGLAGGEEVPRQFVATALSDGCRLGRRPKP